MVLAALGLALAAAGQPLEGAALEQFLRTAEVVHHEDVPVGVTRPLKVQLSDGTTTLSGTWKTVDVYKPGITRFEDGSFERNFRDSYRAEIAAYELDKLLGTGLVPATVERRYRAESGAMQLWIEGATTDFSRREKQVPPPDALSWNRQVYNVRLFRALTDDADYKNARNTLIDPEWRVWAIDSSRAFRGGTTLLDNDLDHFSRRVLARLEALDFETLEAHLGAWIGDDAIRALMARRDLILERAKTLVAERGEGAVLVP